MNVVSLSSFCLGKSWKEKQKQKWTLRSEWMDVDQRRLVHRIFFCVDWEANVFPGEGRL